MRDAIHALNYALAQKESNLRAIENWAESFNRDAWILPEHEKTVEEIAALRRAINKET
ncbi:hypothetical protein Rostov1_00058 [Vibrio phage Rostov-1]|uniref:Uncharacterized protein n=1 Tax=Vibrio phage Rostov-1 TaxID=2086639 RepID=A0A2P0ZKC1_9CAUD|nr:hypothetical protein Rostov1_00058 [Vibrio phage Rostov-1]